MMKGSLRTPSGTIDSESVLSKIPKRTTPQLPPPSQSSVDRKVMPPVQSQPVQVSESPLPKVEALPKKDVSLEKVILPIIPKSQPKAKLRTNEDALKKPKTPQGKKELDFSVKYKTEADRIAHEEALAK